VPTTGLTQLTLSTHMQAANLTISAARFASTAAHRTHTPPTGTVTVRSVKRHRRDAPGSPDAPSVPKVPRTTLLNTDPSSMDLVTGGDFPT
jgi:hypothetical protein